jgi:hypothetical protein
VNNPRSTRDCVDGKYMHWIFKKRKEKKREANERNGMKERRRKGEKKEKEKRIILYT